MPDLTVFFNTSVIVTSRARRIARREVFHYGFQRCVDVAGFVVGSGLLGAADKPAARIVNRDHHRREES